MDGTQPVSEKRLGPGLMSHQANWPLQHGINSSILKLGLDSWIFELGIC